jgi:penicillin-binding protein 2
MVEKYLTDSISRPKQYTNRLFEANLLPGAGLKPKTPKKEDTDSIKTPLQNKKSASLILKK